MSISASFACSVLLVARNNAQKTERLLNLVICLLATRRYLSVAQVRAAVPHYAECASEEAFRRMFERDKEELRELGIPLETGTSSAFDTEPGYRIARGAYELPEVTFEPDEAAAVGLAARMWREAALSEAASLALLKLRAAGVDTERPRTPALEPRVDAAEPAFAPLLDAAREARIVRFDYRALGAPAETREVEPWGVVSWRGHWYVGGYDRGRGEPRVFRLSRIVGTVTAVGAVGAFEPPQVDLVGLVSKVAQETPEAVARLRVRQDRAGDLRRDAVVTAAEGEWDVVEVAYAGTDRFADWLAGYGADIVVLEPDDLREAVLSRLRLLAAGSP